MRKGLRTFGFSSATLSVRLQLPQCAKLSGPRASGRVQSQNTMHGNSSQGRNDGGDHQQQERSDHKTRRYMLPSIRVGARPQPLFYEYASGSRETRITIKPVLYTTEISPVGRRRKKNTKSDGCGFQIKPRAVNKTPQKHLLLFHA